jgi:aryl-alcohol dehydrogenase-like predicted oxidoreductase
VVYGALSPHRQTDPAALTIPLQDRDGRRVHVVHIVHGRRRTTIPRFTADNRAANQALADHVAPLAQAKDATPGQAALAWLLAQDGNESRVAAITGTTPHPHGLVRVRSAKPAGLRTDPQQRSGPEGGRRG